VRVVELLDQGLTYEEIARQVGYSNKSVVKKIADRVMREDLAVAGAERIRMRQWRRLDAMYEALQQVVDSGDDRKAASAIGDAVRILEREAKLMGLDLPAQPVETGVLEVECEDPNLSTDDDEFISVELIGEPNQPEMIGVVTL
jgi:hypothetical protein